MTALAYMWPKPCLHTCVHGLIDCNQTSRNWLCMYLCWEAFTQLCLLLTSLLLQKQAADEREALMRRSLRDADAKHKNQIAHLDASVLELQRYAQ